MTNFDKIKYYSPIEESINIISHATGFIFSIIALILLNLRADLYGGFWNIASFSIFGISLVVLYAASTLYHSAKKPELRIRLKVFDHAAIYVLIAGTYTPLTIITLHGTIGWVLFTFTWTFAFIGIILKLFFTGRFDVVLTIMYVLLGWIVVVVLKPLIANLAIEGVILLFAGGIAYTLGAVIYAIKKVPGNHAIFHFLVLIGSLCHFISIYMYILGL